MSPNKVIIVAGPTASGKSALALDLALKHNGVVINADSMQVYQGLPIITACPDAHDKALVPHHLFEIYDPSFRGNVVDWLTLAVDAIRQAWAAGRCPIVVGGTGLYLHALVNGISPTPDISPASREQADTLLARLGPQGLWSELQKVDPATAARLHPNDAARISRAYEVWLGTGKTLTEWHHLPPAKMLPEADFFVIKLSPLTNILDARCYLRFDVMIHRGALQEVRALAERNLSPSLPAMRALGVPELLAYLKGACTLDDAIEMAKLHTRQYAKRQRTWFAHHLHTDFELPRCYTDIADLPELNI